MGNLAVAGAAGPARRGALRKVGGRRKGDGRSERAQALSYAPRPAPVNRQVARHLPECKTAAARRVGRRKCPLRRIAISDPMDQNGRAITISTITTISTVGTSLAIR